MDVQINFEYNVHDFVPPRCRKPRRVTMADSLTVTVPEVTADEAPVALRYWWYVDHREDDMTEYRWWGGRLYTLRPWFARGHSQPIVKPGDAKFPAVQYARTKYDTDGLEAAKAEIAHHLDDYLIIDGVVWQVAGEPRYEIHTLGLGHNHSSTCISVTEHYNGNLARSRYYRADQHAEAIEAAVQIAERRGDTLSVPRIREEPAIEVLIPEAVQIQPALEHGDGDPFLNKIYAITESAPSAGVAGLLGVGVTLKEIDS